MVETGWGSALGGLRRALVLTARAPSVLAVALAAGLTPETLKGSL